MKLIAIIGGNPYWMEDCPGPLGKLGIAMIILTLAGCAAFATTVVLGYV